jgi:hypothetical protein
MLSYGCVPVVWGSEDRRKFEVFFLTEKVLKKRGM